MRGVESTMIGGGEVESGLLDEEERRWRWGERARRGARRKRIRKRRAEWERRQEIVDKCIYLPMWRWLCLSLFYSPPYHRLFHLLFFYYAENSMYTIYIRPNCLVIVVVIGLFFVYGLVGFNIAYNLFYFWPNLPTTTVIKNDFLFIVKSIRPRKVA